MATVLAVAVYLLCAATSIACAVLLLRGYRRGGPRFLLWSSLCFAGLALNNIILVADQVLLPNLTGLMGVDFAVWRSGIAVAALALLLYGLVWDAE